MQNCNEICEKAKQMYAEKKYTEAVELWKAADRKSVCRERVFSTV